MSVYFEDAVLDELRSPEFVHNIVLTARPRRAMEKTACFVEAKWYIFLPEGYPEKCLPKMELHRCSGLNDEGAKMKTIVNRFLEEAATGDGVLFGLVEKILDYLDENNDGECLICLSSLDTESNYLNGDKPNALRTPCFHCYHITCLSQWAAVFLSSMHVKESAKAEVHEDRASKALKGELKSLQIHLEQIDSSVVIKNENIRQLERDMERFDESSYKSEFCNLTFSELEKTIESLHSQQSFVKSRLTKIGSGEAKDKLQAEFDEVSKKLEAAEEIHLELKNNGEEEQKTLANLKSMHQQLKLSLSEDNVKRAKLVTRINITRNKVDTEYKITQQKQAGKLKSLVDSPFPCPCCRSPLNNWLAGDAKQFRDEVEKSLSTLLEKGSTSEGHDHELSNDGLYTSVSSQSEDVQAIVRRIQKSHASMKAMINANRKSGVLTELAEQEKAYNESNSVRNGQNESIASCSVKEDFNSAELHLNNNKTAAKTRSYCFDNKVYNSKFHKENDSRRDRIKAIPVAKSECITEGDVSTDEQNDIDEAIRLSLLSCNQQDNTGSFYAHGKSSTIVAKPSANDVYHSLYFNDTKRGSCELMNEEPKTRKQNSGLFSRPWSKRPEECASTDKSPSVSNSSEVADVANECICCGDEFDEEKCLYAIGSCNHAALCGMCSLRSRLIVKDFTCCICRRRLDKVLCTSNASTPFSHQIKEMKALRKSKSETEGGKGKYVFHQASGMHVPAQYMSKVLNAVIEYKCKVCNEVLGGWSCLKSIKKHLYDKHQLLICDVCGANGNCHIFASELECYTQEELRSHVKGSSKGGTLGGHPTCDLCKKIFYDTDQLYRHINDEHYCCYICEIQSQSNNAQSQTLNYRTAAQQSSVQNDSQVRSLMLSTFAMAPAATTEGLPVAQYFKNKADLHDHFRRKHFCCKICKKMREVAVYESQAELDAHMKRSHPSTTRQNTRLYM